MSETRENPHGPDEEMRFQVSLSLFLSLFRLHLDLAFSIFSPFIPGPATASLVHHNTTLLFVYLWLCMCNIVYLHEFHIHAGSSLNSSRRLLIWILMGPNIPSDLFLSLSLSLFYSLRMFPRRISDHNEHHF